MGRQPKMSQDARKRESRPLQKQFGDIAATVAEKLLELFGKVAETSETARDAPDARVGDLITEASLSWRYRSGRFSSD